MASLHLRSRLIILFILAALLSPLQLPTLQAEEPSAEQSDDSSAVMSEDSEGEVGTATYYARRYQNRRTSSGKRHDGAKLTAAHSTLAYGTRVRVINLANDKEVVVTINDRCRHRSKPFIDLSRSAAQKLGFLGKGKTRVRIIPLGKEAS
jgi:rare lipoprotein A